jgi:hypothetical protein
LVEKVIVSHNRRAVGTAQVVNNAIYIVPAGTSYRMAHFFYQYDVPNGRNIRIEHCPYAIEIALVEPNKPHLKSTR